MSIPGRITIGLLATQTILFCTALLASDASYAVWAFGGAASCILMMLGAAAAPIAILVGILIKRPSVRNCGFALLLLNTIPLAIMFVVMESVFGDQYEKLGADGTLRTQTVEQVEFTVPSEAAQSASSDVQ